MKKFNIAVFTRVDVFVEAENMQQAEDCAIEEVDNGVGQSEVQSRFSEELKTDRDVDSSKRHCDIDLTK